MEADFCGWATKAGLQCTDGRTIMPNAFEHQDNLTVPLVWQHDKKTPENVLGHAILENRPEGVWCSAYFNDSRQAQHAKGLVQHGDITMLSIWANQLIERGKKVFHGAIREVSLVLGGANPGALIDPITIRHDDGDEIIEDEAIIYTGLSFEHTNTVGGGMGSKTEAKKDIVEFLDKMDDEDREFLHTLIGVRSGEDIEHADDRTVGDIYASMNTEQQEVVQFLVGEALGIKKSDMKQSSDEDDDEDDDDDKEKKGGEVKHNVFESGDDGKEGESILSHEDRDAILKDAIRTGSLKHAAENYALSHGITDIDILFPDAVATDAVPEFLQRRTEWVGSFLAATRKSPFSRIKTFAADITMDEARARGYIKGDLKKEEFFPILRRTTTPQTIYKKQSLDRDDIVDITDFDIVSWLKAEMRIMLDEEIARAALMGDGRDISDEDKIQEANIRPIATDHELYVTTLYVNIGDASSSIQEFIDAVITNRKYYKGSGQPNLYTSETVIAMFLLLKDTLGRSLYRSLDEVATVLRVASIIPVEAMDDDEELLGIIVNPIDYVFGATKGGEVNLFDDFDIDYNKHKYLIETRLCGALTKLKSALVIRKVASGDVLVTPLAPTFDEETGELTINDTTGVVYTRTDTDTVVDNAGSPYTIPSGETVEIVATPASGKYFATSEVDDWTFTAL